MSKEFYEIFSRNVLILSSGNFFKFAWEKKWLWANMTNRSNLGFFDANEIAIPFPEEGYKKEKWDDLQNYFQEITNILRDIEAYRRGVRPNVLLFTLFSDGRHTAEWIRDEKLIEEDKKDLYECIDVGYLTQEEYEEAIKEGDAYDWKKLTEPPELPDLNPDLYPSYYNAYKRRRAAAIAAGEAEEPKTQEVEEVEEMEENHTDGALLNLIISTAQESCPHDDWQEIVVETEVWKEQGKQHIDMSFSVRLEAGGKLQDLSPAGPIAAMNAAELLQKQMFEDDEEKKPWRKLRIRYQKGSSSVQLDYDPEEPLR